MTRRIWFLVVVMLLCVSFAHAHVGSPDVYAEGTAGPYHLFVVIRPPLVIPGVADVEVRAESKTVDRITITPIPLTGEASKHPPVPDAMQQPSSDGQFYVGHLWMMSPGSWQIRFAVGGREGTGVLSIPLPATAMATRKMQWGLGTLLAVLGMLLVAGMIGIIGAATREGKLSPGVSISDVNRRKARLAMAVTFAILVAGVILGNTWWNSEANSYAGNIYKPLQMKASLSSGNVLDMKLIDPGWMHQRKLDDFIPDHDHLMHLYMIRWPEMDQVFHLHPAPIETGEFQLNLPTLPAGDYRLYADVVHAQGFPETIVGSLTLPSMQGRALAGDDAEGTAVPIGANQEERPATNASPVNFALPDGYRMFWSNPQALVAQQPVSLQFELRDPKGNRPADMALYMGMLGHAAIVEDDGSVFAHIHPTGTVAMAAFMMANPQAPMNMSGAGTMDGKPMGNMAMSESSLPNVVGFPYGFPSAGHYRMFVQMKHGQTIETGSFDVVVQSASK